MLNGASAIYGFGSKPPKTDFVPPGDPILEIASSKLQGLLNEMILTHNELAELVRDSGALRGRELARLTENHAGALKAEKSPITKLMLPRFVKIFCTLASGNIINLQFCIFSLKSQKHS